jgi:hypothetical protein
VDVANVAIFERNLPHGRGNGFEASTSRESGRRVGLAHLTRRCRASTGVSCMQRTPQQEVAAGPQAEQDSGAQRKNGPARRRISKDRKLLS